VKPIILSPGLALKEWQEKLQVSNKRHTPRQQVSRATYLFFGHLQRLQAVADNLQLFFKLHNFSKEIEIFSY
jgi:hypothetical protein